MEIQPASAQPAPTDHFTNFTEISYEKTRNSYDQCEVPPATHLRSSHCLPVRSRAEWMEMGGNDPYFRFFRP